MSRNSFCKKRKAFQEKGPALLKALETCKRIAYSEKSKKWGVPGMYSCEQGTTRDEVTRLARSEQERSHMSRQGFWSFSSFGPSEKCTAAFYMPSLVPGTGDTKII